MGIKRSAASNGVAKSCLTGVDNLLEEIINAWSPMSATMAGVIMYVETSVRASPP